MVKPFIFTDERIATWINSLQFLEDLSVHTFVYLPQKYESAHLLFNKKLFEEDWIFLIKLTFGYFYFGKHWLDDSKIVLHEKIDSLVHKWIDSTQSFKWFLEREFSCISKHIEIVTWLNKLDKKSGTSSFFRDNYDTIRHANYLIERKKILDIPFNKDTDFNWKTIINRFFHLRNQTHITFTNKRKSKRYGTAPGTKLKKKNRILIALDVSGSISQLEIKMFLNEIKKINRFRYEIEVVECNDDIIRKYNTIHLKDKFIPTGGATDFSPVFLYANQKIPNFVIYFTDGRANPPRIKPKMPVVWVLTSNGVSKNKFDKDYFSTFTLKLPAI